MIIGTRTSQGKTLRNVVGSVMLCVLYQNVFIQLSYSFTWQAVVVLSLRCRTGGGKIVARCCGIGACHKP